MRGKFYYLIVLLFLTLCSEQKEESISQNHQVSMCGGFSYLGKTRISGSENPEDTCTAALIWKYTPQSGIVEIGITRILVNCGYDSRMEVSKNGETYVLLINVNEDPKNAADCMCFFDYSCELPNQSPGTLKVQYGELYSINLNEGEGMIVFSKGSCSPYGFR